MFFDKSKIAKDHLDFLNPYIGQSLDIFNNLKSYKDLNDELIEDIHDIHMEVLSGGIEYTQNNKLKTYGKILLSNPYSSRIKVEKLPAPNMYSALMFSLLWISKLIDLYVDKFIDEIPSASVNTEGEIDRDLVTAKINAFLGFFGESYFGDREGRKVYKDFKDYEKTPFGSKFTILAAFFWYPYEVDVAINEAIKSIKEEAEKN